MIGLPRHGSLVPALLRTLSDLVCSQGNPFCRCWLISFLFGCITNRCVVTLVALLRGSFAGTIDGARVIFSYT